MVPPSPAGDSVSPQLRPPDQQARAGASPA